MGGVAIEVTIQLRKPHAHQRRVIDERRRFNVLCMGRRWGKNVLAQEGDEVGCIPNALAGKFCAWFAPTYKMLQEVWQEISNVLAPLGEHVQKNKQEGVMRLPGGGRIDFWSLDKPDAGRGRKYDWAGIDEAAMVPHLLQAWNNAIRPTLADRQGTAWIFSTPRGYNDFRKLWLRGQDGRDEWASWQMPTDTNPHLKPEEIAAMRAELPDDAESQEIDAQFLADAANPFGVDAIRAITDDAMASGPVVCWGVDLAKSHDWTVAVGLNEAGEVCAFQRWQSDWRNTRARLRAMIGGTPACVDSTGVGDPIAEDLQRHCPLVEGFKFSAQSKQRLMEGLAVAIQTGEVRITDAVQPAGLLRHELESFQFTYTRTGVRYEAPSGLHDDAVCALALAVACHARRPTPVTLDVGDDGADARWAAGFDDPALWEGDDEW